MRNSKYKKSLILSALLITATTHATPSTYSQAQSFENDNQNSYWTAFDIAGSSLDIMRLSASDNISSTNASFDQVNNWLATSDWRWATKTEMEAITHFFGNDSNAFKSLNGDQWSAKTSNDEWNALIPGENQDSSDTASVAWGLNVQASSFGSVSHKHNFNTSALGGAALLVRNCNDGTTIGESSPSGITVHVATQGTPCGNGTSNAPFSSISEAQDAVRTLISTGQNTQGVTVLIQSGDYQLSSGLSFNSLDSGVPSAPIEYKAATGAHVNLIGGKTLDYQSFTPLSDASIIQKLVDQSASSSILEFDLTEAGISNLGELAPHGWNLEPNDRVPAAMVYSGGEKMDLARWPNVGEVNPYLDSSQANNGHTGMVSYTSVIDAGPTSQGIDKFNDVNFNTNGGTFAVAFDRMSHWHNISDVFIDGILAKSWEWTYNQLKSVDLATKQITLKRGEVNGIGTNKGSHFYFENIIEELDQAGEFFIDRSTGMLYVYPTVNFSSNKTTISTLAEAMLTIKEAQYLSFKGLTLDTGRNMAIDIDNSQFITIENNVIRNFSLAGILINGENNAVSQNEIYNIGGYGVKTEGGSEAKFSKSSGSAVNDTLKTPVELTAANNSVDSNIIHNFAWDQKSQVAGIWLTGVGNNATFNELYNAPHFAILLRNSSDNIVSYNYIHDLPYYHLDDGGALYAGIGNFPHMRGNEVKNNYFENIPTNGVYLDNFSSGILVQHNIFNNVGNQNSTFSGININGGGQILMDGNFAKNSERPVKYNTFAVNSLFVPNAGYHEKMLGVQTAFNTLGLQNTPYNKYSDFSLFLNFANEDDFHYQVSTATNNISYNPDVTIDIDAQSTGVVEPSDGRWLVNDNHDFNDMTTELNNQYTTFSDIFNISTTTVDWRTTLSAAISALPSAISNMQTILSAAPIDPQLLQNGDFESSTTDFWTDNKSSASTTFDNVTNSQVLQVSSRTKHSSTTKQTVTGLAPGNTYLISAKLMTLGTDNNIGMAMSYKAVGASKLTTITIGGNSSVLASNGNWVYYSQTFTLPTDFDPSKNFKIWVKTTGSSIEDFYADDVSLLDISHEFTPNNVVSSSTLSNTSSFKNDPANNYWSAYNINGVSLDIMRLNVSDDIDGSANVSFIDVNSWLASNTDWRWARPNELSAITAFFEGNNSAFLSFNGGVWSPKASAEEWNMLIPGAILDAQDGSGVAWGVYINPSYFGVRQHKHNFDISAVNGAPLLVRVVQ